MNQLASLRCLKLLLYLGPLFYSNAEQEEDPEHIFSGDAVLFTINETTDTPSSWLACSKNDCNFSKRQTTENVYTHARKVFHIYGKDRWTTNDPIRYGDEVALFYRVNDEGYGLWLGCASGRKRCGLGTCPGLPHLNHWMWNSKHECNENKFVVTGIADLQNATLSGQPVKIEHQIKLIRELDSTSITGGKGYMDDHASKQNGAPFLDNSGHWVINKDMIAKCGNKHYDIRYKVCDICGSKPYVRPKHETWKCCAGDKPYNSETSLCCGESVSVLYNTHRSAREARCCRNAAFFPDRQVCCQGKVRDLPGQDTDADDTIVQCCGSEPYLSTHGICCNDVLTPFYPLKMDNKDALECCDDQGFNNRTSFCYNCGKNKHVLPLTEKQSWSCCKDKELYKDEESRCCEYGVEKGAQCKCQFQNNTYISGQRFSEEPAATSCRSCICNDGNPDCQTVTSCPATLPFGCSFYPANDECCPVFQCFNSEFHNYKLFLRRKSHVSLMTAIPEMNAMTISFWMKTQQSSEGTVLSYATQSQADEIVIKTHPSVRVILKGSSQGNEVDWDLDDGNWHFLWITWESSTGHLTIREGARTIGPLTYTETSLEGGGYLVLGQRQQSQKQFIEAKAFVGEISHLNIWSEKKTEFDEIRKDCIGFYSGSIFHLSDHTIDTHQSASIIATDTCPDKALHFPKKGVDDFVTMSGMSRLTAFTICLWMISSNTRGTVLSYNAPDQTDDIDNLIIDFNGRMLSLHMETTTTGYLIFSNSGIWNHVCWLWESSSGSASIHRDGWKTSFDFVKDRVIREGGTLVLGQRQGSFNGNFESDKSFQGMLSNVNVWNHVLTDEQIEDMSTSCLLDEWNAGNVFKWRSFLNQAATRLVKPSTCEPLGLDAAFHFPSQGVDHYAKYILLNSLTAFTMCLWMSSSNTQGTVLSYALPDQLNELVIYYNRNFWLMIDNDNRETSVSASNGLWHHICVSWASNSGTWKFFKDGDLRDDGTNFKESHVIRARGKMVLGQIQTSLGGGFDAAQSFEGMLSNVNGWDRALTSTQIKEMSQSCLLDESGTDANIMKWYFLLYTGGALPVIKPSPCEPLVKDNELHFPNKGVDDFVQMSGMDSLSEFTVCLWMKSSSSQGPLVSYAVPGKDNELLITFNRYLRIIINQDESRATSVIANDGVWHQICVTWESNAGAWKCYKDGKLEQGGTGFKSSHVIAEGGSLVLGQEQDSVGGGFDADQSFQGMLSNVNIWNQVLTAQQIKEMSKLCLLDEAADWKVFKWLDFLREADARLVKPSSCEPMGVDNAFHFPDKGVSDVVKSSGMRSLTAFTVCFWMSSTATQGSPFSYAVTSQHNELLIFYNKYFELFIGGAKRETSVTANDGAWHHICVSWQSNSGSWKFYKDCDLKDYGDNYKTNYEIGGGGTSVLGQEQHSVGGGFVASQSFQGFLSNVNVWDYVLPTIQVKEMSQSCLLDEWNKGNVYEWFDFLHQGGAKLVKPSPCEPFRILNYAFHFPNKDVNDYIKLSEMPTSLTAFTACLWMSSSDSQGNRFSLFSYAVPQSHDELLIYYDGHLELKIGGRSSGTSVTVNVDVWHHICVSWENDSGSWKFYSDGVLREDGTNFRTGYTIRKTGGTLVLGQRQHSVGGGFQAQQSFQGMLSSVNVWDEVLSSTQINDMSKSCQLDEWNEGNVLKWSDFVREGGARLIEPSPCKPAEVVGDSARAVSKSRNPTHDQISEPAGDWIYRNGHYYSFQGKSSANSWFAAEGFCREQGKDVHLASIHSQPENDFIKALAPSGEEQWIGLTNHNIRSNVFKWMDRSNYGDFTHWDVDDGEPNYATVDEDCVAMKPDGKWIDVACRKQRLESDTPFDRRAFTCKTSGNTVNYTPLPSLQNEEKEVHEPAISVVDLIVDGQSIKVSFFTGLSHIAPNGRFSYSSVNIQYGALLKFGGYVDMTQEHLRPLPSRRDNDLSGVADLDGVVDKIEIPHYSDMSEMGSATSLGFSLEFWIRPRRMPVDTTPMALFLKSSQSSGSISLNLNVDGSLTFSATPSSGTPLTCTTDITDDTHKIERLAFHHIAVTGTVGSSLMILVNGDVACQTSTWEDITVLPASNEGTLVFGENELDIRQLKRFNGQISNIQLFNTERTQEQIETSIRIPNSKSAGSIGFWSLRQSDEINAIHYVISSSQAVSELQFLEDYTPPPTRLPVEAVVRNQNIYIFRWTEYDSVIAKFFALSADKSKIERPLSWNPQTIIASSQAEKNCVAATLDQSRDRFIVMECYGEDQSRGAVRFKWNIFDIDGQGQITPTTQDEGRGSFLVTGIGSVDTRLSAKVVENHLLLTAGTTSSASTFFLDLTLDSNGFPSISIDAELAAESVGTEEANRGATFYVYLYQEVSASSKPFLRRICPLNCHVSPSYIIDVIPTDPCTLVANTISSNMPDNDWFWFLFKISTLRDGIAIQSGDRISIQTPDNNPQNEKGWSFVKSNCDTLHTDQQNELLNFWIFKTESCDPQLNGGYSVVSGEIGPNDCILLWPKTEQFEPGNYQHNLALPSESEIQSAKVRFGSWFGPWRLMIPTEKSPERPIPLPANTPQNSPLPRNVYQGNKYPLLHFGETISVESPSALSGVRGGLLQFAKTTVTPVIVSNNENPALVKIIFRGNGGTFPHVSFPHDEKAKLEAIFSTVYREGSYAQQAMTSGLFYSIEYTPPSDSSSPGEFKKLARIGGLDSLEYPTPPTSFVWLIPPPFKITGMCAAISTLFRFNTDTVTNIAPNSVATLTEVVNNAVGSGSFGEGLFKPFVSVPFDVTLLKRIGEQVHDSLMNKIRDHIPQPPSHNQKSSLSVTHSWQELGELEACVSLSNLTFWEEKVQKQKIKDRLKLVLRSKWMNEEILKIRQQVAPTVLHEASARYSAYGGIAVLIATRLRSPEFLEELLTNDKSYIEPILDSHLKVLDAIRPDLGLEAREDIMSALLAKEILKEPWTILHSLDEEDQREAISMAIMTIHDGNVPEEVRTTFTDVMKGILNAILYPLTSTQLGVFSNFLDMRKLDVLKTVDNRAKKFKVGFLDFFVRKHTQEIAELNQVTPHFQTEYFKQPIMDQDGWAREIKKYYNLPEMREKQRKLRNSFQEELKNTGYLIDPPTYSIDRVISNNPRFVAGLSHAFNVLGAISATYNILKEITDPNSGFRQGNKRDVLSVAATTLGGVGAIKGTYDFVKATYNFGKVLKEEAFQRRQLPRSKSTWKFYGGRQTEEIAEDFEKRAATEVSVELNNMERASNKLVGMLDPIGRLEANFFTALGVVADGIFFGISVYDLYTDFAADNVDSWKVANDFAFAASAGAGALFGIASILGIGGAITGVGTILVMLVGIGAVISDAFRQAKRQQEAIDKKRCDQWQEWCSWSKNLFERYGFLVEGIADPCIPSNCPQRKKDHILRMLCSNRRLLLPATKGKFKNGLNSWKDIKNLIPSLGKIEKKTCPAWLRHVYKGQGKRRGKLLANK